jgi:hypothetical protein
MTATTLPFDPTVTSTTGDLWTGIGTFGSFNPITVNPGQSGTINVTITSTGASGTVVTGALYIDAVVFWPPPSGGLMGSELAVLPYTYKIK